MSKSTRIGGVTVQFNEDGALFIYQPDSSRVMGLDLARELAQYLVREVLDRDLAAADVEESIRRGVADVEAGRVSGTVRDAAEGARPPREATVQSSPSGPASSGTVPAGVINTSEGPEVQAPAPAPKRRGRPPRKAT